MKLQITFYMLVLETFVSAVLFLLCLKQLIEKARQKIIIENLNFYNETLIKMYDGIRSLKHDFVNFVQALDGYIKCNDIDGVKSLIDSIYTECKSICNMETLNPEIINNPGVYNLLVNKYRLACDKNIIMNVEVNCDLSNLDISIYNLCRILGILLDNAIEAVKECKEKIINVRFIKELDFNIVIVENSYQKDKIDIDKIFEKGYSTKTKNDTHGLGLWKVKDIVDHANNLEIITHMGTLFCQELKIKETNRNFDFLLHNDKILLK
ncbi:MAG: GHKL domain-containing protein [Clostridia bacterium]|nr:GHKL domain-containing protein [Clostridia bacterium]